MNPITIDERKALRRRAHWTVSDFARYTSVSSERARRALLRYNTALGGTLLKTSTGANRRYGFYWALLAAHAPDAFLDDPLEMQHRVDALEDLISDMQRELKGATMQVGWVTREFAKLQARRSKAA